MPIRPEYLMATNVDSPFYGGTVRHMTEFLGAGDRLQTTELPAGWLRQEFGVWEGWTPRDWTPRLQGWKIHVSASMDCAVTTLERVTRVCVDRDVAFKFLPSEGALADTNGKQQDRGSSGKFITIYPADDAQFAELLATLEDVLTGQQGPYILSDLRYGDAPVYARYGGIMALNVPDERDNPVASVVTGDAMTLTKDDRGPRFVIPEGVELPECLKASYERSRTGAPSRLRDFKAISPMHFSNAGGVYKATLPDGTVRALREARSHTGLDGRGRDAVTRQLEEEKILRDLVNVEGVQRIVDSFWAWEHRYLELEYVDGRTLTSWVVLNSPYDTTDGGERKRIYGERCRTVARRLIDTVERIHAAGWCIGDLHPGNIMVDDADQVVILDLEDGTRIGADREVGFRVFEFCAPEEFDAREADWYAISRSIMLMYVADWELEVIAPSFWDEALRRVEEEYGPESVAQIREVLAKLPATDRHLLSPKVTVGLWDNRPSAEVAIEALDAGVEWSRQYSATESFPGDPTQGGDTSESFGYGRAGVVFARARMGRPVPDADVAALKAAAASWSPEREPGLFTGLAGLALALCEVGAHEAAIGAARRALAGSEMRRRLDLFGGQAGVLLAGLEVAGTTEDADLRAEALKAYERLHRTVVEGTSAWTALTHRRGLHFGLTGVALVDIAAHLLTGERGHLGRALARLQDEVDACFVTKDGDMMVRDVENNRALPYIEWGSAGVWAILQVAERLAETRFLTEDQLRAFARACSADFYVYPGLDHGRAGCMAVLAGAGETFAGEVQRQKEFVLGNLLHRDGMAFTVGDGFLRLSSDLSTGAAGTALALHTVLAGRPFDWLPISGRTADRLNALGVPDAHAAPAPDAAPRGSEALEEVSHHG